MKQETLQKYYLVAIVGLGLVVTVILFAVQFWIFRPNPGEEVDEFTEDQEYWKSEEYQEKIENQTVESFTQELFEQANGDSDEFSRRHPYDTVFVNKALSEPEFQAHVAENYQRYEIFLQRFAWLKEYKERSERDDFYHPDTYEETDLKLIEDNILCEEGSVLEKTGYDLYEWRHGTSAIRNIEEPYQIELDDVVIPLKIDSPEEYYSLERQIFEELGELTLMGYIANRQDQHISRIESDGVSYIFHDTKTNRISMADMNVLNELTYDSFCSGYDKELSIE